MENSSNNNKLYLLVASFRYEDTNDLVLCHCNAAETLEGTTKYLFDIFDDVLKLNQKALDEIDGNGAYHSINDADYLDYLRKRNGFLLPYATLRYKVKKNLPLKMSDFSDITIFAVGAERGLCLYLNVHELDSYQRAFDIVEVTIDMLGYWDEYFPKLKETNNTNELFTLLYEACQRYNNAH